MSNLLTNWGNLSRTIADRLPYVSGAIIDRDISVDGQNITLFYNYQEVMMKTIAKTYKADIQSALHDLSGIEYNIRIAER